MNVSRSVTMRQTVGIAASAAVLVLAVWAGTASAAASGVGSPQAVGFTPGVKTAATVDSAISSMPAMGICCPGSTSPGLTASGQASVQGQGTAARDAAIAKAVADATDQAKSAAKAAGITLGAIIDMQVSAPYFAYPMEGVAAGSGVASSGSAVEVPPSGGIGYATGGSSPGAPPIPTRIPVQTFASVTITWAIG
jgi:hypothetical protein